LIHADFRRALRQVPALRGRDRRDRGDQRRHRIAGERAAPLREVSQDGQRLGAGEAAAPRVPGPKRDAALMLRELQQALAQLYRLEPSPDVRAFVVDEASRRRMGLARAPREQLLLVERDGELEMGLFVDPRTLKNLERHDPRHGVGVHNLSDLCVALEGVSHFVFVAPRAREDMPVSSLELELQAEVDKYVTCVLLEAPSAELRAQLFERVRYHGDLSAEERERYAMANDCAA